MSKIALTFDKNSKQFLLEVFNKAVDEDGYIVERSDPSQKVLSPDGEPINIEDFAGIKKGSEVFFKSDLISIIKLSDNIDSSDE